MMQRRYMITMILKDAINVMMEPQQLVMYRLTNVYPVMNILTLSVTWWTIILPVPTVMRVTLSVPHPPQITSIPVLAVIL